jgi:hypothetical protein
MIEYDLPSDRWIVLLDPEGLGEGDLPPAFVPRGVWLVGDLVENLS